jgi:hypothetical protein
MKLQMIVLKQMLLIAQCAITTELVKNAINQIFVSMVPIVYLLTEPDV